MHSMAGNDRETAVADLRLSVYVRPIHPEFFTIRVRQVFRGAEFHGEIWLLDPGHVILFLDGPYCITEVIAPRGIELPERGRLRTVDITGESEERIEARGPLVYHTAYQVDAQDHETYLKEAEELLTGPHAEHIVSDSPREAAKRQFSYASPEARPTGLLVHAWHGFPAESTILKTQTLIERV